MRSNTFWKCAVAGALGGFAASWVMNQSQSLWAKAAEQLADDQGESQEGGGEDATVKTAKAIAQYVFAHELTEDEKKWAGPAVHYGFGTLVGAAYGLLVEAVPSFSAGFGTVYGSLVWFAADEVGVPLFGLSQSPLETPISSHVEALASHLVYGVTTDMARRLMVSM